MTDLRTIKIVVSTSEQWEHRQKTPGDDALMLADVGSALISALADFQHRMETLTGGYVDVNVSAKRE